MPFNGQIKTIAFEYQIPLNMCDHSQPEMENFRYKLVITYSSLIAFSIRSRQIVSAGANSSMRDDATRR